MTSAVVIVTETPGSIILFVFVIGDDSARHLSELIIGKVTSEIVCEEDSFVLLIHLHDLGVVLAPSAHALGEILLGIIVLILGGGEVNELLLLHASLGSYNLALN